LSADFGAAFGGAVGENAPIAATTGVSIKNFSAKSEMSGARSAGAIPSCCK
jgi:hypothetical protein